MKTHLADNITGGRDGLLFPAAGEPAEHLAPATLYKVSDKAREEAGRPDLRYPHAAHDRDKVIAEAVSDLATKDLSPRANVWALRRHFRFLSCTWSRHAALSVTGSTSARRR